jgi:hypothetical protein
MVDVSLFLSFLCGFNPVAKVLHNVRVSRLANAGSLRLQTQSQNKQKSLKIVVRTLKSMNRQWQRAKATAESRRTVPEFSIRLPESNVKICLGFNTLSLSEAPALTGDM